MMYHYSDNKASTEEDLYSVNLLANDDEDDRRTDSGTDRTGTIPNNGDADDDETVDPSVANDAAAGLHALADVAVHHHSSNATGDCQSKNKTSGDEDSKKMNGMDSNSSGQGLMQHHTHRGHDESKKQTVTVRMIDQNESNVGHPINDVDEISSKASSTTTLSPATKTLNNLSQSQQTANLRYDLSQLDDLSENNPNDQYRSNDKSNNKSKSKQPSSKEKWGATKPRHLKSQSKQGGNDEDIESNEDSDDPDDDCKTHAVRRISRPRKVKSQQCSTDETLGSSIINRSTKAGSGASNKQRHAVGLHNQSIPILQVMLRTGKVVQCFPSLNSACIKLNISKPKLYRIIRDQEVQPNGTVIRRSKNHNDSYEPDYRQATDNDEVNLGTSEITDAPDAMVKMHANSSTTLCSQNDTKHTLDVSQSSSHYVIRHTETLTPPYGRNNNKEERRQNLSPSEINSVETIDTGKATIQKAVTSNYDQEVSKCKSTGSYVILHVTIDNPGSLGLNIGSAKPSDELVDTIFREHAHGTILKNNEPVSGKAGSPLVEVEKSMIVTGLMDPSLGGEAGIEVDDWLFYVEDDDRTEENNLTVHLDYEKARDVAKDGIRPLSFAVARWTPASGINKEIRFATVTPHVETTKTDTTNIETTPVFSVSRQSRNASSSSPNHKSSADLANETAPFCTLCNQAKKDLALSKRVRSHHAWCPRNPHFILSGANKVYDRIRKGVELRCEACLFEFSNGRLCSEKVLSHSRDCQRNQEEIKRQQMERGKKKKKKHGSKNTANINKKKAQKSKIKSVCKVNKHFTREEDCTHDSNTYEEASASGDDSVSVYQCESKRPIHRLVPATRSKIDMISSGARKEVGGKKSSMVHNLDSSNPASRKRQRRASPRKPRVAIDAIESMSLVPADSNSRIHGMTAAANDDDSLDDDSSEKLFITWETCENPWGNEGHVEGDVVIFSSVPGFGQVETLVPEGETRFALYPFSAQSQRYNSTHHMPEEGFQSIVLQRNALATRPWGFSVHIHEFGGACLVHHVDLLSPAAAATFLGSGPGLVSPLRLNDMILEINGKRVGGMTLFTVTLELEVCGPRLTLLVSRYKFADEIRRQMVEAEASYLKALDNIINDDRRLDWADIGATNVEVEVADDAINKIDQEIQIEGKKSNGSNHESHCRRTGVEHSAHCKELHGNEAVTTGEIEKKRVSCYRSDSVAELEENNEGSHQMAGNDSSQNYVHQESEVPLLERGRQFEEIDRESISHRNKDTHASSSDVAISECLDDRSEGTGMYSTTVSSESCKNLHDQISVESPGGSELENSLLSSETDAEQVCDNDSQNGNNGVEEDEEDGSNVLFHCVCGMPHGETTPVFWIQCENCQSWFNAASTCIGFTEDQAPRIEHWTCPGCPDVNIENGQMMFSNLTDTPVYNEYYEYDNNRNSRNECKGYEASQYDVVNFNYEKTELEWLENAESRWRSEHQGIFDDECIRPRKNPRKKNDGTWRRPVGKPPSGYRWDAVDCLWRPFAANGRGSATVAKSVANTPKSVPKNNRHPSTEQISEEHIALGEWYKRTMDNDNVSQKSDVAREVFNIGDLVQVQAHSWPGVDNPDGVAKIVNLFVDEDGDQMYDIKYVVDRRTKRGVLAQYVNKNRAF